MRRQLIQWKRGLGLGLGAALLCACQTTSNTVHVDQNTVDPTLPSVLTLQVTAPGQPTRLVMVRGQTPGFPDVSIDVNRGDKVQLKLVAKDDESGIQRLELAGLLNAYRGGASGWTTVRRDVGNNFGIEADTPYNSPQDFPRSVSLEGVIDIAQQLQQFDAVVIHLSAVAKNGSPQLMNQDISTNTITLVFKPAGTPAFPR